MCICGSEKYVYELILGTVNHMLESFYFKKKKKERLYFLISYFFYASLYFNDKIQAYKE